MAYTTFPAYARYIFGYEATAVSNVTPTDFEDGYTKQDPVNSQQKYAVSLTYALDSLADKLSFEAWRRDDLVFGAFWFDWVDPTDVITRRARIVKGEVKYKHLSPVDDKWQASFDLEFWG
jgi:hypothetical protein